MTPAHPTAEAEEAQLRRRSRLGRGTHWAALGASVVLLAAILGVARAAPTLLGATVRTALVLAILALAVQAVGIALSFRAAPVPLGSVLSRFRRPARERAAAEGPPGPAMEAGGTGTGSGGEAH